MNQVSIIITCFNYGRFLAEAIDSALAQTYPAVEVLVMDDGSSDHTPEVASHYASHIRYIRTPNRGQCATLNDALQRIQGAYYICLDADNVLFPRYVAETVPILDAAGPDVGFVYTQRVCFGEISGVSAMPAYNAQQLKVRNYIDACALIRTELGRRHGYDAGIIQSDYDFFLTLAENGVGGVLKNEPLFRYRVHSESMTGKVVRRYRQLELTRQIVSKHAAFYSGQERAVAFHEARGRIVLAVIQNRLPDRPFSARLLDFLAILKGRASLPQVWNQLRYIASPRLFMTT